MTTDYDRIARAIAYLETHAGDQPTLADVAEHVGLSRGHLQRVFRRWAGVSPKRFLQALTLAHVGPRLRDPDSSVLDAALDAGLSGPGRLHDLMVSAEAVTPGEYRSGGRGVVIRHGTHHSPLGRCHVGLTDRGVCHLAFLDDDDDGLDALVRRWPAATLVADDAGTRATVDRLFPSVDPDLRVLLKGTNFQLQVWRALLTIPTGDVRSYSDIARAIGRDGAARAVGRAVASNAVALLIPCHRVLRASSALAGYRWGPERKRALLALERARTAV